MTGQNIPLEKECLYEILLTTQNEDKTYNTKPFGITLNEDNKIEIKIFPNKTLKNIKKNPEITIQFTQDILTYTKALLGRLERSDYVDEKILKTTTYIIDAEIEKITQETLVDNHGKTVVTNTTSQIINIQKLHDQIGIINRPASMIMELLIKYSRVKYMHEDELDSYYDEITGSIEFIKKQGNNRHLEAINMLKKTVETKNKKRKK